MLTEGDNQSGPFLHVFFAGLLPVEDKGPYQQEDEPHDQEDRSCQPERMKPSKLPVHATLLHFHTRPSSFTTATADI